MDILDIEGKDFEKPDKDKAYYERIMFHKNNVLKAFENLIENPASNIIIEGYPAYQYAKDAKPFVVNHDMSKFGDIEFDPYRVHWLPTAMEAARYNRDEEYQKYVDERYEEACLHHVKNNRHHPDYWCFDEYGEECEPKDMDIVSIIEMICDWEGMSMEKGGSTKGWWAANRENKSKKMTPHTVEIVDHIVEQMPDILYRPEKE